MKQLEAWADTLIASIGPNAHSESLRREIYNYLRRLILSTLQRPNSTGKDVRFAVFRHGSVPLMTYLTEGDLDIGFVAFEKDGAMKDEKTCDDYLNALHKKLSDTSICDHAMFPIRNVTLIDAEVRVLKCSIRGIAVDICANKVGGCCGYILLDLLDRIFKRSHLFKRSIILIKCWCAYESHTLGSRNGLMSTYALEIMIVNLFYLYYHELYTPLQALIKFVEYYSTFDWDEYAVTACGPISLSTLKDIEASVDCKNEYSSPIDLHLEERAVAYMPNGSGTTILELVENCRNRFKHSYVFYGNSVQRNGWRHTKLSNDGFIIKSINIVDPLNNMNNIGRSVSESCFMRIRAAFAKGHNIISHILANPSAINRFRYKFFKNSFSWMMGHYRSLQAPQPMILINNYSTARSGKKAQGNKNSKQRRGYHSAADEEEEEENSEEDGNTWKVKTGNDVGTLSMMEIQDDAEDAKGSVNNVRSTPHHEGASLNDASPVDATNATIYTSKGMTVSAHIDRSTRNVSMKEKKEKKENEAPHINEGLGIQECSISHRAEQLMDRVKYFRGSTLGSADVCTSEIETELRSDENTVSAESEGGRLLNEHFSLDEEHKENVNTVTQGGCNSHDHFSESNSSINGSAPDSTHKQNNSIVDTANTENTAGCLRRNLRSLHGRGLFHDSDYLLEGILLSVNMFDSVVDHEYNEDPRSIYPPSLEMTSKTNNGLNISETFMNEQFCIFESDLEEVLGLIKFCELLWSVPYVLPLPQADIWAQLLPAAQFLNRRSPKSSILCSCPFQYPVYVHEAMAGYPNGSRVPPFSKQVEGMQYIMKHNERSFDDGYSGNDNHRKNNYVYGNDKRQHGRTYRSYYKRSNGSDATSYVEDNPNNRSLRDPFPLQQIQSGDAATIEVTGKSRTHDSGAAVVPSRDFGGQMIAAPMAAPNTQRPNVSASRPLVVLVPSGQYLPNAITSTEKY